jgi:D-alanyl-D-alanine carboxypeptidase
VINKSKILFLLVPSIILTAYIGHIIVTRPLDTARFFSRIEAKIAATELSCSENSPKWMLDLIHTSLHERGSLANQIVYKEPSGKIHHCENGWVGRLLFSQAVNQNNRYRYASITKLITADLTLRLIDEGQLKLDQKLVEIFSEIKPLKDQRINDITIAHLLNHTAGFDRNNLSGDIMFWSAKKNWCPYNLEKMSKEKLDFTPGEKQVYSNLGYCLLGAVIEKTTGMAYAEYAEKIYGLNQYNIKFVDGPYLADEVKYDFRNDNFQSENYFKEYNLVANRATAGASGSATGLVQLMDNLLSRQGLSLFAQPSYKGCDLKELHQCYGHAFTHYQPKDNGLQLFTHTGYLPGSSSILIADNHGGIVVLLNAGTAINPAQSNRETILKIYSFLEKEYKL